LFRARQRANAICVNVEVGEQVLDFLISTNWLRECHATSAKAIAEAIRACLEVAAKAAL
jgi:hypothetical protein